MNGNGGGSHCAEEICLSADCGLVVKVGRDVRVGRAVDLVDAQRTYSTERVPALRVRNEERKLFLFSAVRELDRRQRARGVQLVPFAWRGNLRINVPRTKQASIYDVAERARHAILDVTAIGNERHTSSPFVRENTHTTVLAFDLDAAHSQTRVRYSAEERGGYARQHFQQVVQRRR